MSCTVGASPWRFLPGTLQYRYIPWYSLLNHYTLGMYRVQVLNTFELM